MDFYEYFSAENVTQSKKKVQSYVGKLAVDKGFLKKIEYLSKKYPKERGASFWGEVSELCLEYGIDPVLNGDQIVLRFVDGDEDIDFAPNIYVRDFLEEDQDPVSRPTQDHLDEAYPVAISLSPYTTRNDLVDYVETMWASWIKPQLDAYKGDGVELGGNRVNRKTQERDSFICKNKQLHPAKIIKLLRETFGEEADTLYKYQPMEPNYVREIIRKKCGNN